MATGLILLLAANTAFNGFPVLGSILARDRYMPRQLDTRGDRLAFSNGILVLAFFAIVLIVAFDAQVTRLIQLYIVGRLRLVHAEPDRHGAALDPAAPRPDRPVARRRYMRSRGRSTASGSWSLGRAGRRAHHQVHPWCLDRDPGHGHGVPTDEVNPGHYDRVSRELEIDDSDVGLPSRVHAIVLVSKLHKPTMRALAYARVSRPNSIEALTVEFDPAETEKLMARWDELEIPVPLKVINSPYRELVRPVLRYVKELRKASPRDVITVYIPEYVVGRWWEQLLHNQTALRLKGRLLFMPGVMVTSVPYQLDSAGIAKATARQGATRTR